MPREAQTRHILLLTIVLASPARAQIAPPAADGPGGATLFRRQCATCHALGASDPKRQGPHLAGIIGRKAGGVDGYAYSASYRDADFAWDEANLDPYLANPQAAMPGSVMAYRQANAAVRQTIIAYLKGLN